MKRSSAAFNPGPTNLQPVSGKFYVPKQFGPRVGGKDIFEADIESKLGKGNVFFVDCWDLYHVYTGEVHCGSYVKRECFDSSIFKWWENIK